MSGNGECGGGIRGDDGDADEREGIRFDEGRGEIFLWYFLGFEVERMSRGMRNWGEG